MIDFKKITKLRLEGQWTMEELAKRAGFSSRQQWWNIENGRRPNLRADQLHRVARALGVTMDDLMK